ncbi:hypothetical protein D8I24_7943 [Cupriavidus necator H850]|uniref:glycosyltransferase family 4 protein n=1 Tax=Cupriavidus necator TaxID=106590 RepID=UPI00129DC9EB|nr:glycosyltransferase family 4 protein [Cupriavidus necator]KAI3595322.1 hypothetical protein D8I24_7943 [Cupriavidus necator H850]
MAGPSLGEKGGISAVAKAMLANASTVPAIDFVYIASWGGHGALARAGGFFLALLRLSWLCARGRVDIVHLHTASRGSFMRKYILSRVASLFGVPYIVHLHGAGFHDFYRTTRLQSKVDDYFREASIVIVLGEWWKTWVDDTVGGVHAISIVRNGVPSSLALDPGQKPARTTDETGLLFLGRLGKRKGLEDLLRTLAQIRAEDPTLRFSLTVGGDGDWQPFQAVVDRLGLNDCVRYMGWIDSEAKLHLLDSASVLVLPSYNEGLPVAIVEAMSRGLPVISTTVGSIPEVLENEKEGWIIRPGDLQALKCALLKAATDRAMLTAMQANAYQRYRKSLCLDMQMVELSSIYRRALSGAGNEKSVKW